MPKVRRRVRRIVRRRIRDRVRRLSGQTHARFVLLVSIFVPVAAIAAFVCVAPPASSACPIILPKPLRVRYKESALVAVVRVADPSAVEPGVTPTLTQTPLRISSLLKGESKDRVVDLHHYVWRGEDGTSSNVYEKGDELLVFLNPVENGSGYISSDSEQGVMKLSPDDLKVYVSRIRELATIMRSEKPDTAALTEWLVRCIEEPATRWEGAYDLAADVSPREDPQEESASASPDSDKANSSEVVSAVVKPDGEQAQPEGDPAALASPTVATLNGASPNGAGESGERVEPGEVISVPKSEERIDFAALITPAHKERLLTALLAAEELKDGEQMLLRLVSHWKDERLVPFSLKHLSRMADKPPFHAEDLMRIVAHTLADRTLIKFVADYSKAASYDDLNYEVADYNEEELEASELTAEERATYKKEIADMKTAAAEALLGRSGKLRHFLALAAQPQQQP